MDRERAKERLRGCYLTVPTMFRDPDLELDLEATRKVVRHILDGGFDAANGELLSGGAAGDFSTMTFDERCRVCEGILEEAGGAIPVVMGAQTACTRELVQLAKAAERMGAEYIQISPPFYFNHGQEDFYEYVCAAAEAADIGIVIYNTFWTTANISLGWVERIADIPNVVGLKWATPRTDAMEFEQVVTTFAERLTVIDNQVQFTMSHMMGARALEAHPCVYWPQWGIRLLDLLDAGKYAEAQETILNVAVPFYKLWTDIEVEYTSGDGYLDKLCLELVGLPSSRNRPPTRDVREHYRERTRRMLIGAGVPGVCG